MDDVIVRTKTCPMCKAVKPVAEFYNNRYKKDGLSSNCRKCHKSPRVLTDEERKSKRHWRFIDLSGRRFERLVALCICDQRTDRRNIFWNCLCDCGNTTVVDAGNLRSGAQKSCGCLRNEKVVARHYVHGMTERREYGIWCGIKKRCFKPTEPAYKNYGGRGITMCDQWRYSFEQFITDMGDCPDGYMIDRIDNNGNYEPENCRWATRTTQNRNTRRTKMITHNGETLSLREWAERFNMNFGMLRYRYENGLVPLFGRSFRLTDDQRRDIRAAYATGTETLKTLATRFGVASQTIANVVHEKTP